MILNRPQLLFRQARTKSSGQSVSFCQTLHAGSVVADVGATTFLDTHYHASGL